MDIIISAEAGEGKTAMAVTIIKAHLGVNSFRECIDDVFQVTTVGDNSSYLAQKFREGKPQAILFDGCINDPHELRCAIEAVKKYREQTGRPRTLAVYVEQQPNVAVILVTERPRVCSSNSLKGYFRAADAQPTGTEQLIASNTPRSIRILDALWTKLKTVIDENEARQLSDFIYGVSTVAIPTEVPPLKRFQYFTHEQRLTVHNYMLKLLLQHETKQ
jgi:hypothetical protein